MKKNVCYHENIKISRKKAYVYLKAVKGLNSKADIFLDY